MQTVAVLVLIGLTLSRSQVVQNEAKCSQCCDGSTSMAVGVLTEKVAQLVDRTTQLETRIQNSENELLELKSITRGTPKIAFSAALLDSGSGNTGPFNVATPLKYKKVFANFGSNYNSGTGIFTASVKGVYFFRFTMFNNLQQTPNSVVSLRKNGVSIVTLWDVSGTDSNDTGSNAAVLPLEVGDTVHVELAVNRIVYDDQAHYNTFTGFLLFTN